jgi:hypothetical protein
VSPDLTFLALLMVKMVITAAFVVAASITTERSGPVIGALITTLPVSAGPSYVFLSLDHDTAFIAQAATASLAINAATGLYTFVYSVAAQRAPLLVAMPLGLALWFLIAFGIRAADLSILQAVIANAVVYAIAIPLAARFRHAVMPRVTRRWFDVPLRAAMVATLVAIVVTASNRVGPATSGIIATFPIVFTSLILILHPRIGGPATAAVIANGLWGLIGFGAALLALHFAVVPLGAPIALSLGLAVAVGWNAATWVIRRRNIPPRPALVTRPSSPPSA